jgi:hypothetical protein
VHHTPIQALNAHLNAALNGTQIGGSSAAPAVVSRQADVRPPLTITPPSTAAVSTPAVSAATVTPPSVPAVTPVAAVPVVTAAPASVATPAATPSSGVAVVAESGGPIGRRKYQFEDVELRRSRAHGLGCRVTLRRGDQSYIGEADGSENERLRTELAARATLAAIKKAEGEERVVSLEGCKTIGAFEREFVFVGVMTRYGRESVLMTGSAEVRESPETASVLAVLDATNRWLENPGAVGK